MWTGLAAWTVLDGPLSAAEPASFTFAALNDLHLQDAASAEKLGPTIDGINGREDIAFAVVLGDLTTAAKPEEFALAKGLFSRFSKPWYAVPGNHDVNGRDKEHPVSAFEEVIGPACWRHAQGDWQLIGLNSCDGLKSDVTLPEERLNWLKSELAQVDAAAPIALFLHHPMNPNSKAYRIGNAEAVLQLFKGHNLRLAAAGHFHGNQEETRDGVLFTTTACCSATRGNHDETKAKGYRLFHCANGEVRTEFVEVPGLDT